MISVVYCTREHNQGHLDHIKKMAGHPKVEVLEYVNNGESLTKCYNEFLDKTKFDIVVFLHDDITIKTKQFAKKLKRHYDKTDYGILGVAGTKNLPESGRWWDNMRTVYGKVWHTHEGKEFLSSYSEDQGTKLEEVVMVDGVFFSVMKSRLKTRFDEAVEGFHFYDVDFCLRNHLEGVKVGVHTNIIINHMSIGETNEQWEENRVLFVEKYKDNLPLKINKVFKPNHKFKVLLGCLNFKTHTGSELHVYELAKELVQQGCDVTVCSDIGRELAMKAKQYGIKVASINEPPGYKRGDGQWQIMNQNAELVPSVKGSLYRIKPTSFDIMHLNHTPVTKLLLQLYPEVPAITTIHSEVIALEHPVIHDNIKKYIAIRPEIKDYIVAEHNVPEDMVEVIYNPIDRIRFSPKFEAPKGEEERSKQRTLFVGTIDYLRREMLLDLIKTTKEANEELWIVGSENGVKVEELIGDNTHVKYQGPRWNVEWFIKMSDKTAGILLGRTTIEGWMCGKPGWIYDVDDKGVVKGKTFHEVPEDVEKFRNDVVVAKVIEEYKEILK
jgi:glycosyltransferase involved in cell wall biosynthesis